MRKYLLFIASLCTLVSFSQESERIGIGIDKPTAKLDVNGNFTTREKEVSVDGSNKVLIPSDQWSQVQITGNPTNDFEITAIQGNEAGQKLIIFNNTTSGYDGILLDSNGLPSDNIIHNGELLELVFSAGEWRALSSGSRGNIINSQISLAVVPEFDKSMSDIQSNPSIYETENWRITEFTTNLGYVRVSANATPPAVGLNLKHLHAIIVYEYKDKMMDLDNIHTFAGSLGRKEIDKNAWHLIFSSEILDIYNDNGRTYIKVLVVNHSGVSSTKPTVNNIPHGGFPWETSFNLNILLFTSK